VNWNAIIREAALAANHDLDDDIIEELATHARTVYETERAEGRSTEDAIEHARALIGSWMSEANRLHRKAKRAAEFVPIDGAASSLAGLLNDIRYGVRILVRQKKYAAIAILTMGLGIGILTILASVANGVLLKPLPWPQPDRLVRLAESRPGQTRQFPWAFSNGSYLAWAEQPSTIESLAGWSTGLVTMTGVGDSSRIRIGRMTASTFTLLRATPLLGGFFTASDEPTYQGNSKVVLSYGLWQQRFGGDPSALGRIIQFDGKAETIVGVMPRDFTFPDSSTVAWIPYQVRPVITPDGKSSSTQIFSAMARLRPGVTPAQAGAEATARAQTAPDGGLATLAMWGTKNPAQVLAAPALAALTGEVRPAIIAMFIAVLLLLCAATANVAGLQLARAATRRRELAIRSAIGAGTWRIVRQLLIESLLLSLAGGAFGLLLAVGIHRALPSIVPPDFPRLDNVAIELRVVAFAFSATLLAGLVAGLVPALQMRRVTLVEAAVDTKHGKTPRARMMTMVGQIAVACTLLIGASLLSRSFLAMMHADRGYDLSNLLTVRVLTPSFLFSPERRLEIVAGTLERVQALPGVNQIAFTDTLPLSSGETLTGFTMPSPRPPVGSEIRVNAVRRVVSADYFRVLGVAPVAGRVFESHHDRNSTKSVVVNTSFAKKYLSDHPVGNRISNFAEGNGVEYEVIGVIPDVMQLGLQDPVQAEIYSLVQQMPITRTSSEQNFILKISGDPRSLVEPLREILRQEDASLIIDSVTTMENRLSTSLARPRLYAILLGAFASSALIIAATGLFGVLSYNVAQRTREFAVRTALGATPGNVVRLVLKEGLGFAIAGIVAGLAISFAFIRYLTSLLYGITPHDSLSIAAVCFMVVILAMISSIVPAIRAVRIDPIESLKS
jgi:putative ABC transport system permease protein